MSWLIAKLYDRVMSGTEEACLSQWRESLLLRARGEVLEVGAGTGLNLEHYPDTIEKLVLVEPDRHMRAELEDRLDEVQSGLGASVKILDGSAEDLPFEDESFDTLVSTLVLCSVDDPAQSLAEYRRVLKPGGLYIFLEHVAAEGNPGRLKWQRRIEPIWGFVADNCHLTRRSETRIREAGFEIEEIERESMRKAPPFVRPTIRGIARKTG